jgi:methylenetetrahydrofolate reductase (NADPH)
MQSDDAAVKRYGITLATKMIQRLLDADLPNVRGVHFCTLNLEKSVRTIMENLGWVQQQHPQHSAGSMEGEVGHTGNKLIDQNGTMAPLTGDPSTLGTSPSKQLMGLSISPQEAATMAELGFKHRQAHHSGHTDSGAGTTAGVGGKEKEKDKGPHQPAPSAGAVGVVEDWDEYPNGRFTDVRSPAYGEIDGYGNGLKVTVSRVGGLVRRRRVLILDAWMPGSQRKR